LGLRHSPRLHRSRFASRHGIVKADLQFALTTKKPGSRRAFSFPALDQQVGMPAGRAVVAEPPGALDEPDGAMPPGAGALPVVEDDGVLVLAEPGSDGARALMLLVATSQHCELEPDAAGADGDGVVPEPWAYAPTVPAMRSAAALTASFMTSPWGLNTHGHTAGVAQCQATDVVPRGTVIFVRR
jgi:hypothetical protein